MDAALDEITMPTEIVAAIGEGALAYRESGILSLADGRVFSACRQYRYRLSEDSVVVEFADGPHIGTQFLSLSFSRTDTGLEASGVYACGDDTYHATYRILGPAAFEVVIMVQGPAKAYELVSLYGSTTYCNFYSHVKYSPLASSVRVIYVAFCCYTAPDIQPFFD